MPTTRAAEIMKRASRHVGVVVAAVAAMASSLAITARASTPCANSTRALGVERIVEIDTATGAHFGDHTKRPKEPSFLKPKEVVLTFDDGPMPGLTRQILDTLDQHCTRATWFSVGRMAVAYPELTRDILRRGHTLGTHTWSHPLNLPRLRHETAVGEIEKGFAAVAAAAGEPIAPFFRFPGLNDSNPLLQHLQSRGISAFTVDVISDDSYIQSTERLIQTTLARVEARGGGILLFHDIKAVTARALPTILAELKSRGYRVVHMRPAARVTPLPEQTAAVLPLLAKQTQRGGTAPIALAGTPAGDREADTPIERLAPPARVFAAAEPAARSAETPRRPRLRPAVRRDHDSNWATTYRSTRRVRLSD